MRQRLLHQGRLSANTEIGYKRHIGKDVAGEIYQHTRPLKWVLASAVRKKEPCLFHLTDMPFGLHSEGAIFHRLLYMVISVVLEPKAFAYLNDLVRFFSTFDEHIRI